MDHHHHPWGPAVKDEYEQIGISSGGGDASSSSSSSSLYFGNVRVPQAIEALHDAGPPPFVTKTFDMVDDPTTARTLSWSRGGHSFVVWDPHAFSTSLLPKYFKHSNFSSFVRQLNTYGFRKIDPERWEFANEGFLMGHKHLLKYIKRRKVLAQPMASQQAVVPCVVELGEYGGGTTDATEVDRLRRDKEILMLEMEKLRQHQQKTRTYLQTMEERIQRTQQKQRYTMTFIARAVQNPAFIHQLLQQKDKRKELEEGSSNGKRRLSMSQKFTSQGQGLNLSLIRADSGILQDDGYEVSELEALALEIQGYHKSGKALRQDEEIKFRESMEKELDEEFWEELLSTGWLDIRDTKEDTRKDEDVSLLADKLGYLGSIPNLKAIHGPKPVQVQTRIPRVTSDDCRGLVELKYYKACAKHQASAEYSVLDVLFYILAR